MTITERVKKDIARKLVFSAILTSLVLCGTFILNKSESSVSAKASIASVNGDSVDHAVGRSTNEFYRLVGFLGVVILIFGNVAIFSYDKKEEKE